MTRHSLYGIMDKKAADLLIDAHTMSAERFCTNRRALNNVIIAILSFVATCRKHGFGLEFPRSANVIADLGMKLPRRAAFRQAVQKKYDFA
jgi:hypothetical protein